MILLATIGLALITPVMAKRIPSRILASTLAHSLHLDSPVSPHQVHTYE